jgi:hypothetical protein
MKKLRAELHAAGVGLTKQGWRRLKRGWAELSRPEREQTTVHDLVEDLKAQDRQRLEARLKRLPRKQLEALHRKATERDHASQASD